MLSRSLNMSFGNSKGGFLCQPLTSLRAALIGSLDSISSNQGRDKKPARTNYLLRTKRYRIQTLQGQT